MENPFLVKSKKTGREVTIEAPKVLLCESLEQRVELLGTDLVCKKTDDQIKIDLRSHVRSKLESETDGEFNNSDEDILALDLSNWKPELRVRKTAEETAADAMGGLTIEQVVAAMAIAGHDVTGLIKEDATEDAPDDLPF